MELWTLVIYDVAETGIRNRVITACKDYGLARFQYSAFRGKLNANMRQQLFLRIKDLMGNAEGRIFVFPVCEKDIAQAMEHLNPPLTS